jgi:hypothetical protein
MAARLSFLVRVVRKECAHLQSTDERLFAQPFTDEHARAVASDPDLAERLDAFVSRFGRLQDTVGDKLLPALLDGLGEPLGAAIDNLDRAEKLGLLTAPSAIRQSTGRLLAVKRLIQPVQQIAGHHGLEKHRHTHCPKAGDAF